MKKSAIRPWHYALGIGVVVVVLAAILVPRQQKDSDKPIQLLQTMPLKWEKFIASKQGELPFYEESNVLHVHSMDNGKGIYPVLDETSSFYKVYAGEGKELWVKKKQCREVVCEPITRDMLDKIFLDGERLNSRMRMGVEGEMKGLVLFIYQDFMHESHLETAILDDGRLICPMRHHVKVLPLFKESSTFTVETGAEPLLKYGTKYQLKEDSFMGYIDLMKLSWKQVEELWRATQGDEPHKVLVYYYFPSENTINYYNVDLNVYCEGSARASDTLEETTPTVKAYSVLEKEGMEFELMAEVNGEMVKTGLKWEAVVGMSVEHTADFDGDGSLDAIVFYSDGGSAGGEYYELAFYNREEGEFQLLDLPFRLSNIEEWKNKKTLVNRSGISMTRYVLEGSELKKVEEKTADVGKTVWLRTRESLFPVADETSEDQETWFDIDGDGEDEMVVFGHDNSHANNWGQDMYINRICWNNGRTLDAYFGLFGGSKFEFLDRMTKGMHDLLVDSTLFRWNGSAYDQMDFSGTEMRKAGGQ